MRWAAQVYGSHQCGLHRVDLDANWMVPGADGRCNFSQHSMLNLTQESVLGHVQQLYNKNFEILINVFHFDILFQKGLSHAWFS